MRQAQDKRRDLLLMAKTDISLIGKLYPDMGGKQWQEKYDALLKDVQKTLGEEPTGLEELGVELGSPDESETDAPAETEPAEAEPAKAAS